MIIDARSIPPGQTINADACIVGAGPVGIVLARELSRKGLTVSLLESGGLAPDTTTQSLNRGERDAWGDYLTISRSRQFGGTANRWLWETQVGSSDYHARFATPDPIDLEKRDWMPHSGWPFSWSDLADYRNAAQALLGFGSFTENGDDPGDYRDRLPFVSDRVQTRIAPFAAVNTFTRVLGAEISQSRAVNLYLHANAVKLDVDDDGHRITRVRVATLQGTAFVAAAKVFLLAAGGIENARLLLLSNDRWPSGIANHHDRVGRFFMEHPLVRLGVFRPARPEIASSMASYDFRRVANVPQVGGLVLSEAMRREERLLSACVLFVPRPPAFGTSAFASLGSLVVSLRQRRLPKRAARHVAKVMMGLPNVAAYARQRRHAGFTSPRLGEGGWSNGVLTGRPVFYAVADVEQVPDPSNRIVLGAERDLLGQPRARLEWHWNAIDLQSLERTRAIIADELKRADFGEFVPWLELDGAGPPLEGSHHHMGTTRMDDDPEHGVVDRHCRVHGMANLFMAGSSVFPTGAGFANPTFTAIALALRLADRLKVEIAEL